MAILNSIILTLFQAIILFVIIKILNNINYNFRDYISILGIIIPSTIVFYFFNTKAMIVLLIGSAIFIYFKNKVIGLVSILIIFFILYIANFLSIWLAAMIYDYIETSLIFNILYLIIFAIITLFFSFIARFFMNQLLRSDLSLNKIYLSIVGTLLLIALLLLYSYVPNKIMSFADIKFVVVMYAVFIITIAILIITISFSIIRQIQYKRNMQEIENYYKYTLQIENINNEMRKFRHDYVNILSTMSEFIRESDMDGLKIFQRRNFTYAR